MQGSSVFFTLSVFCGLLSGAVSAASVVIDDAWVAKNGSVVTGNYTGTTSTPAISVKTIKPVTIENATVSGPGNLIMLDAGANVSVLNTHGSGTNPNTRGAFKGSFIKGNSVASLLMQNCTVNGVYFGIYLHKFSGNRAAGQTIKILKNIFHNIDGRPSDGKGGYQMSGYDSHAHAIQLNAVQAVPGIEIAWNEAVAIPYQSLVNDVINIYSSSGTTTSHLRIHDNYVQGPMGPQPGNGEKYSGGGIITDGKNTDTAATATAYVDIYNNQVTMTGNYGVAVAAGHDNNIYNNRVVSAGFLADGTYYSMVYANAANNGNLQNQTTSVYYNNHVHDNLLGLIRKNSSNSVVRSDWWLPGQTSTENNQHLSPNTTTRPSVKDEQAEWVAWQRKLASNGIKVGVQTAPVSQGTVKVTSAAGSDSRCLAATDTVYFDGASSGTTWLVSSGVSKALSVGAHPVSLASGSARIPAGGSQTGTCSSVLSAPSAIIVAGQTAALTATYRYHSPATAVCAVTQSAVTSLQRWNITVDGFHQEVTFSGFPVDASGNVTISGIMLMKNDIKNSFWSNQRFSTAFNGKTGTFTGGIYSRSGAGALTLDGYLTDGTPLAMKVGDVPLQSLSLNGIPCAKTFMR